MITGRVFYPNHQIAAGHNNVVGLTPIEYITPVGDTPFTFPQAYYANNPGAFRQRLNARLYVAGLPSFEWIFSFWTKGQYAYFSDTFCGGGYDGLVTVRAALRDNTLFANYNATVIIPKLVETGGWLQGRISNVRARFINLEVIP